MRSGTDAGQFDDSQSLQWSRHKNPPPVVDRDIAYLYNQVDQSRALASPI